MKKIVSLVLFAVALAWTWNVIHTTPAIGFETHSGIQTKLSELISNTIATKRPTSKDLQIKTLWTENLSENKVRAIFSYQFVEVSESGEELLQSIEGEAILHREVSPEQNLDKWVLQSVKTTNDSVVFSEGSVITSGDESTEIIEGQSPNANPSTLPAETPNGTAAPVTPESGK